MTCRAVGGNLQGRVVVDGVGAWLLVETGRGDVEARTYWCVATSHALNVVDGVDGVLQLSLNWAENALRERHGPCTHRPCVYKPNTFVRRGGTPLTS